MTVEALAAPDDQLPEETTGAPAPAPAEVPELATGVVAGLASAVVAGLASAAVGGLAPDVAAGLAADVAAGAAAPIGVRLLDGGIIQVTLPPNEEIAGAEARVAGAAVRALAIGRRMPVLLVITGVVGVSVEARHVYASSIAASAFALVGESPVDRVIAHYLLRSKTETIPAQFFTSEAEAVEWLGLYASED
ncbi:hypothetical protein ACQCSU_15750 [Pseudarthrobacter sp. O4]|uniref:DUF7793 family protein n=1 Tax=Pseudarthrobacter sp. O4 TaxID=3418417 RepID=UPI003CEFC3AE